MSLDPVKTLGHAQLIHARRLHDKAHPHQHEEVMLFLPVQGRVRFNVTGRQGALVCDEHLGLCVLAHREHAHEALDDEVEYLVVFLDAASLDDALDAVGGDAASLASRYGAWTFTQTLLLREVAAQLCAEAAQADGASALVARSSLSLLAVGAARALMIEPSLPLDPWRPLPVDERLARAMLYARAHYKEFPSVDALAQAAAMSRRALERAFRQALDVSPRQYLEVLRLHEANRMLKATTRSVTEIAFEVGYKDLSHFIKAYMASFGQSPTQARSSARRLAQTD